MRFDQSTSSSKLDWLCLNVCPDVCVRMFATCASFVNFAQGLHCCPNCVVQFHHPCCCFLVLCIFQCVQLTSHILDVLLAFLFSVRCMQPIYRLCFLGRLSTKDQWQLSCFNQFCAFLLSPQLLTLFFLCGVPCTFALPAMSGLFFLPISPPLIAFGVELLHYVFTCFSNLTSFVRSCCPAQLPALRNVRERGEGRRPPPLNAVLRRCHTSFRGLQREDVLAWATPKVGAMKLVTVATSLVAWHHACIARENSKATVCHSPRSACPPLTRNFIQPKSRPLHAQRKKHSINRTEPPWCVGQNASSHRGLFGDCRLDFVDCQPDFVP